ncbi:hypothetical protein TNIN_492411 [Trichonephila inaurata madagascariensis]|uniref:Uncharacterized protein n=1 Tax=Trichonephila inaurata madagascariensis TaxID=2747483 RepID=A0A8X7CAK2_9ARAC|nr:hypothetical protein TNIN_492411 [Trichonephila inaurata madagascariensis]
MSINGDVNLNLISNNSNNTSEESSDTPINEGSDEHLPQKNIVLRENLMFQIPRRRTILCLLMPVLLRLDRQQILGCLYLVTFRRLLHSLQMREKDCLTKCRIPQQKNFQNRVTEITNIYVRIPIPYLLNCKI